MVWIALVFALEGATLEPPPRRIAMSWEAPAACPQAAAVAEDLTRLTNGAVVLAAAADDRVRAAIVAEAGGYTITLELGGRDLTETRRLAGPRCETLARAATVMIAVALAPVPTARTMTPPQVANLPTTTAVPDPAIDSPTRSGAASPSRVPSARPRVDRLAFGAWTGPSLGTNPRATAIVGVDVGWRRGVLGLQLSGWHAFAAGRRVEAGVGVRASLTGGGARLILALPIGPVEVPVSLGVDLGAMIGTGTGTRVRAATVRSLWSAAVVGVGLAWPARGRIALAVRAEALATLRAPGIHLDGQGERRVVFVVPQVGARVLAGPLLRLP